LKLGFWITPIGLYLTLSVNAASRSPEAGVPAPEFIGQTAEGKAIKLSDYRGNVVLLDFWASWCGPCREEMPFLIQLGREYRKQAFQIIAVNIDDKVENMVKFMSKFAADPGFPVIFDQKKTIPQLYDIETMPTTILIDQKGAIRFWHHGFKPSHKDRLRTELESLLKEIRED
jgi:thiol-disulfide isomerase/thioredoxin